MRSQVLEAVRAYAADMRLDTEGIESKVAQVDPTDPEAMQKVLADGLFHPEPSESQKAALTRLETWLALVEGWVDVVTDRATRGTLPHADALAEVVRRRRATRSFPRREPDITGLPATGTGTARISWLVGSRFRCSTPACRS